MFVSAKRFDLQNEDTRSTVFNQQDCDILERVQTPFVLLRSIKDS